MAEKTGKDKFANLCIVRVLQDSANVLKYTKIETGISFNEKVAWIINRIEYGFNGLAALLNGTTDSLAAGLSYSNTIATPNALEPLVIDIAGLDRGDFGTAANAIIFDQPIIHDFSGMPGGGLIVPPNPLHCFVNSAGLSGVAACVFRLYYTVMPLPTEDFWELVEARRVLTN